MKLTLIFIFLLFHFSFLVLSSSSKQWCWTKPAINFTEKRLVFNAGKGGSNWGFCAINGPGSNENVPYRIYIETSNLITSSSSGIFYITLFGEENETDEIVLTQSGFEAGSTTITKILGRNVGDVIKIKLRNGGVVNFNIFL